MSQKDNIKLYKPYKAWMGINLDDKNLMPVYFSLPKPPSPHLVDGYGLHPDDQYFRRLEIPNKLRVLEQRIDEQLQNDYERNSNNTISEARKYKLFWTTLEDERQYYEDEIAFIKKVWWHRTYGYFFYNDGEITFMPPDYFDFVNFWQDKSTGWFEYREKDREKFCYKWYLENTTETFSVFDKNGMAVKVNGKYEMRDTGSNVFAGSLEPKTRRSGATHQALHKLTKAAITTFGNYSTIVSMDGDNAGTHFEKKLMPAYWKYPFWLRPITKSKSDSTSIKLSAPSHFPSDIELGSIIAPTTSASEKKNDGDMLNNLLSDEEGKAERLDVYERWNVNRLAMSLDNGLRIIGWSDHPSTVEEMTEGGLEYYKLAKQSCFYQRSEATGQTISGLARIYFPNYRGVGGFIDRFGRDVIDTPTERQMQLSPHAKFTKMKKGIRQIMQEERDQLLREGSQESLEKYRSMRRKQPMEWAECWIGDKGSLGFNMEKIDKRMGELRRMEFLRDETLPIKGNFIGDFNNPQWVTDMDKGRFEIIKKPNPSIAASIVKVPIYDAAHGTTHMHFAPAMPVNAVCCGDVFGYDNKKIADRRDTKVRQSDGGIAIFEGKDPTMDTGEDISLWKHGHRFILSYRYRTDLDEYCGDVLRACVACGAMLYPERNKERLWEFFIENGFGGYLLYDIDIQTGKQATKPGFFSLENSKNDLFAEVKAYIDYRCHEEMFIEFLRECKDIEGPEYMKLYDRLTAHGGALLGYRQLKKLRNINRTPDVDLAGISMFMKRRI